MKPKQQKQIEKRNSNGSGVVLARKSGRATDLQTSRQIQT